MTDRYDDHEAEPELRERQLPPADDERIRRLLAEARHTEPMPEAVATRLDDVLASLNADRVHEDDLAPVVDLAARRRRRTAANLLVAAAAVLVVGVGISQVVPHGMSGSDGEPAATSAEDNAAGGSADPADSGDSTARNAVPEAEPEAPSEYDGGAAARAFQIRSESFGTDVRQARRELLTDQKAALLEYPAPACLTTDVGVGDVVAATYDGAPAAIVLRTPSGDVQVVDLFLCGDSTPRRSITLTAP
jgi:hypothetical protein